MINWQRVLKNCGVKFLSAAGILILTASSVNGKEIKMSVLTPRQESIATAAAYAARGDQNKLKAALAEGLDKGVTVNEFKEVLVQVYAYCGFPRSLNALGTFMALLEERGGKDEQGKQPHPLPNRKSLDFGTENQTKLTGREVKGVLFEFAPAIDEYLKAHLFGDIFGRDNLDWQTREAATIAMLAAMEGVDSQLEAHKAIGRHNGLSEEQIAAIVSLARRNEDGVPQFGGFPAGKPNTAYAQYFSGRSWLAPLSLHPELGVPVANVTFEPGCRNNWHSHSGGQVLIVIGGTGYYQERGKAARRLSAGDVVEIPADVEHWHGAAPDSWFAHLAVEAHPQSNKNTWLEPVSDVEYKAATGAEK